MNATWTLLVYFLFKFSFRDFIHDFLSTEDYYKIFEKKAKDEPLKVSLIIRFLYIPQIYKNFFLCLFDISFQDFYWPALLQYFPYLALPLFIGSNLKSLTDFYHKGHIPNSTVYYSVIIFILFVMFLPKILVGPTWICFQSAQSSLVVVVRIMQRSRTDTSYFLYISLSLALSQCMELTSQLRVDIY